VLTEFFSPSSSHQTGPGPEVPRWRNAALLVREAACGLRGHDYLQHAEAGRIFLRCADCGHETHGWSVDIHG
jgi:hypothetical protein